jgi:hypothetical protein
MRSVILVTLLLAIFTQVGPRSAAAAARSPDSGEICGQAVRAAERMHRMPRMLLHAVSLAESGRWDREDAASFAWPWTINAGGKGKFFPTREAALNEIRRLRANGVRNIDVGCMQVNLGYHGDAFTRIEEALDPVHNVAYAAIWLKQLRGKEGSWAHAVGRYHTSKWKEHGQDYWRKVNKLWTTERKREFRERRAMRMERGRPRQASIAD